MSDLACKINRHLPMFGPKTTEIDPETATVGLGDNNMFGHSIFQCIREAPE